MGDADVNGHFLSVGQGGDEDGCVLCDFSAVCSKQVIAASVYENATFHAVALAACRQSSKHNAQMHKCIKRADKGF